MAALKRGTLVLVDWTDSETTEGWQAIKDVTRTASKVHSAGWVLYETEQELVLAADVGDKWTDEETVNRSIVIPRGMITRIRKLV